MSVLILSLFSGLSLAFGILSFYIAIKNRSQAIYTYFGVFSFSSGLYFLTIAVAQNTGMNINWLTIFFAAVYYGVFPWFVFELIGKKNRPLLFVLSSIFVVAFIAFLLDNGNGEIAVWQMIAHIGLIGLIGIALYGTYILFYNNESGKYVFAVLSILFAILGLDEIIGTYSGYPLLFRYSAGILPLDIYPLLFTLIMGKQLSDEIYSQNKLKLQLIEGKLVKQKLENEHLRRKELEDKLLHKTKDLTDFGVELARKKESTNNTYQKLLKLKNTIQAESAELNDLIIYVKSLTKIDNELKVFHQNVDKVNHEFISSLKKSYPVLTDNELHLASLLRLKLSTKEIASIKNITPDSVKVLRYRLRKKLNLPKNSSLSDFLNSLHF